LGVSEDKIFFTSGATESNSIVLYSLLTNPKDISKKGIITSAAEHPSVRENCLCLKKLGLSVNDVGLNEYGAADPAKLEKIFARHNDISLVSLMSVNNETGVISDIPKLAGVCRAKSTKPIFFHTDIAQAIGKIQVDLNKWDVDAASLNAHKIGGPCGIGLLYLKKPVEPLCKGGSQENGVRAGTENTGAAAALAECLARNVEDSVLQTRLNGASARMAHLINTLLSIDRVKIIPQCRTCCTSNDEHFSPYILQIAFDGIPGEVMQRLLDDSGFAVSTGSACSQGSVKRPVLDAMGIDSKTAFEGIRISQGHSTTVHDIDELIKAIKKILEKY
jgi:cysteine desulfurase